MQEAGVHVGARVVQEAGRLDRRERRRREERSRRSVGHAGHLRLATYNVQGLDQTREDLISETFRGSVMGLQDTRRKETAMTGAGWEERDVHAHRSYHS